MTETRLTVISPVFAAPYGKSKLEELLPIIERRLSMDDALDAFQYQIAAALGVPMERFFRTTGGPTDEELLYYRQVERNMDEFWRRPTDRLHFRIIVRPLMLKLRRRRPKFARCYN